MTIGGGIVWPKLTSATKSSGQSCLRQVEKLLSANFGRGAQVPIHEDVIIETRWSAFDWLVNSRSGENADFYPFEETDCERADLDEIDKAAWFWGQRPFCSPLAYGVINTPYNNMVRLTNIIDPGYDDMLSQVTYGRSKFEKTITRSIDEALLKFGVDNNVYWSDESERKGGLVSGELIRERKFQYAHIGTAVVSLTMEHLMLLPDRTYWPSHGYARVLAMGLLPIGYVGKFGAGSVVAFSPFGIPNVGSK